jgi:hypothetical protein
MKWSWSVLNLLSRRSPGETEEHHEKPHDNRFPGRDSNPSPPEYKSEISLLEATNWLEKCLYHFIPLFNFFFSRLSICTLVMKQAVTTLNNVPSRCHPPAAPVQLALNQVSRKLRKVSAALFRASSVD